MRRIGLAVVLAFSLVVAPLAAQAQPQSGKAYRIAFLAGTGPAFMQHHIGCRHCGRACVIWATWKGRTLSSSTDGPRGSMIGSPTWRPNWCVSR